MTYEIPQPPETPKLKDMLVSMRLPHEEGLTEEELKESRQGHPSTCLPPEIQRELSAKLARCARMIIDPKITSPLYPHKAEQRSVLGYNPQS